MRRFYYIIFIAVIIFALLLTGCKNDNVIKPGDFDPSEFVFVPEFFAPVLPEGTSDINVNNLTYSKDKLYFSSSVLIDDALWDYDNMLYSMDLDGSNITALPNYDIGKSPPDGAFSNFHINAMTVDKDGNIWIAERGQYFRYDLPEGYNRPLFEAYEYLVDLGGIKTLRKLDSTGAELLSLDTAGLFPGTGDAFISSLATDSKGNVYVNFWYNPSVFVLDKSGNIQFTLSAGGLVYNLITITDGTVGCIISGVNGSEVRFIDSGKKDWGNSVELSLFTRAVLSGIGGYSFIHYDEMNLYAFDMETGESVKLLSWIDSDIITAEVNGVVILPDGRIFSVNQLFENNTGSSSEFVIYTKTPFAELPEKIMLTFATFNLEWTLQNAIVRFNRASNTHRITVIDYAETTEPGDWHTGFMKLVTEITTGNVPDIIDMFNMPYRMFASRGLLEDLYPFIESDAELNRSDFIAPALRAAEIDGKLYQVFPAFGINTLIGNPTIVGENAGWNIDEFKAVIDANPEADHAIGSWLFKNSFFKQALELSIEGFIDWTTGEVFFNRGDFSGLLEFANTLPADYTIGMTHTEEHALIASGRQIMVNLTHGDLRTIQLYRAIFGGDIVFKGFPTANRRGNTITPYNPLAITTTCADKDGAWSFVRTVMTENWQLSNTWDFPTHKNVFNQMLDKAKTPYGFEYDDNGNEIEISNRSHGFSDGFIIYLYAMTEEESNQVIELVDSVSGLSGLDESLWHIISESANDYFNGKITLDEAVRIIQSRTSIFVSEQSRS